MPGFEPRNPAYAQRDQSSFERQQHDYFDGGIIGTIADSAGGYAGFTLLRTLMTMHGRPDP
jgi:acyl-coenzyme A thioesterase PaaI-like protein